MNSRSILIRIALAIVVIVLGRTSGTAQEQKASGGAPNPAASIENLNIPGGDAALPPLLDSAIDANSPFRQVLFRCGIALRLINTMRYAQNTLQAPVPAAQQVYVGQHPLRGRNGLLSITRPAVQFEAQRAGPYVPENRSTTQPRCGRRAGNRGPQSHRIAFRAKR